MAQVQMDKSKNANVGAASGSVDYSVMSEAALKAAIMSGDEAALAFALGATKAVRASAASRLAARAAEVQAFRFLSEARARAETEEEDFKREHETVLARARRTTRKAALLRDAENAISARLAVAVHGEAMKRDVATGEAVAIKGVPAEKLTAAEIKSVPAPAKLEGSRAMAREAVAAVIAAETEKRKGTTGQGANDWNALAPPSKAPIKVAEEWIPEA